LENGQVSQLAETSVVIKKLPNVFNKLEYEDEDSGDDQNAEEREEVAIGDIPSQCHGDTIWLRAARFGLALR